MNHTQFLQNISSSTGTKALELGGIKVWIALAPEGGLRIPIDDANADERACKARGKLYFQSGNRPRYAINIQSDHKRRSCKVYFQRPSGRIITTILKRNLMPGIAEYRQRKGSAQYCFDRSNTGTLFLAGKATADSSMGVIVVKIREDIGVSYSFTFELQHFVKQDSEESTSEGEEDGGIISNILGTRNIRRPKKVPLLTWRDSDTGHHTRISPNTASVLGNDLLADNDVYGHASKKGDNIEQSQEKASKKRKRLHSLQSDEPLSRRKVEVESENELDRRPEKTNNPAKKRLCVLLDKYKEEIVTAFKF